MAGRGASGKLEAAAGEAICQYLAASNAMVRRALMLEASWRPEEANGARKLALRLRVAAAAEQADRKPAGLP